MGKMLTCKNSNINIKYTHSNITSSCPAYTCYIQVYLCIFIDISYAIKYVRIHIRFTSKLKKPTILLLHINAFLPSYNIKGKNTLCHVPHKDKTTFIEVALDCWVLDYCVVFSTSISQLSITKQTLNS